MILFFRLKANKVFVVGTVQPLSTTDLEKLSWLFSGANPVSDQVLSGRFIGPRKEMITPWSTNAVEISQNMGIVGIQRIEEFFPANDSTLFDKMLQQIYQDLDQDIFSIHHTPDPILEVEDLSEFNDKEGLALNLEEIEYLNQISKELGRKLTDSEVFGFSQVNSEHCRHKIFNGTFIIDGAQKEHTLFQLIKKTSQEHPNLLISAYKDNVAFIGGPTIEQFAPASQDQADFFQVSDFDSIISLKAETHNFPTTVEPFNGAATGSGGEIRDRLAGGKGSLPLAGTAVYMTSYPRLEEGKPWEKNIPERNWLYQTPTEILIKASDGASDFGNKFGQPLICGSVLTFEHLEGEREYGFDKVIMLAGGIGFGKKEDGKKESLSPGDKIVLLGGDNYRIGMGGGAVSSVATGEYANAIELNAVQRANPEMQKRVMNAIRAMVESKDNPIITIHDHGAGGHLNCFSELLEETGGNIYLNKLPIGDPTLSDKEIISNESQERMGLGIREEDLEILKKVSARERAPFYIVGEATGDHHLLFAKENAVKKPIDLQISHLFGSSPLTIIRDQERKETFKAVSYDQNQFLHYLEAVLQLESVACKDWLTNKVDRSVTGKVATQQTCGAIQLPLNNVAVMALDFLSNKGVATAIGHAPAASLINPVAGSQLAIAESLTNLVWAPLTHGLKGVSLSANWMWPCKNQGEDARLYQAVEAVSNMAIQLGINIPTGKDSLSMTQKYPDGKVVYAPGTVIISAAAEVSDITRTISPVLQSEFASSLLYIDLSSSPLSLGGSAFSQITGQLGDKAPSINNMDYFSKGFSAIQELIGNGLILAGHDISAGGLIVTLLEMCFPNPEVGLSLNLGDLNQDLTLALFSENPAVVIQTARLSEITHFLDGQDIQYVTLGDIIEERKIITSQWELSVDALREKWYSTSHAFDKNQRPVEHADKRFKNYAQQKLEYQFPANFTGSFTALGIDPRRRSSSGIKAAIIREKGVNGDREMAYSLYLAGFDVKDIHMTDLVSGREDLSDVNMIVFVGGFSNSDVLGSAKGWAGAFLYNDKAQESLKKFYARTDTLSLGVCNGCQLMMELGLLYPDLKEHPKMHHNGSHKFESAFINLTIPDSPSILLKHLGGSRLGAWVAHGEGRFVVSKADIQIAAHYSYDQYPGNPNDSDFAVAAVTSHNGRHLAIMPHIERSLFPWNWPYYQKGRSDQVSPWITCFTSALEWVKEKV